MEQKSKSNGEMHHGHDLYPHCAGTRAIEPVAGEEVGGDSWQDPHPETKHDETGGIA